MIPDTFSDDQLAEVARHPSYQKYAKDKCPTCGGTGKYRWLGKEHTCEVDRFGHVQMRLLRLFCLGNVPEEHLRLIWSDYPFPNVAEAINEYIEHYPTIRTTGLGYEFYGPHGTGKTWAACEVLKRLLLAGHTGWFTTFWHVKNLFDTGTPEDRNFYRHKLYQSEILVVDDMQRPPAGASEKHRWLIEDKLEEVLRTRSQMNLPTLTTTNMTPAEIKDEYPRLFTILSGKQYRVEIKGDDGRPTAKQRLAEMALKGEVVPIG